MELIYVTDFGWAGSLVIIANSWEEAYEFAKSSENCPRTFESYLGQTDVQPIQVGVVSDNMGDR